MPRACPEILGAAIIPSYPCRKKPKRGTWSDFSQPASNSSISACQGTRSEEHTSELQSLMRISYAVFCLKKKKYTYSLINKLFTQYPQTTTIQLNTQQN